MSTIKSIKIMALLTASVLVCAGCSDNAAPTAANAGTAQNADTSASANNESPENSGQTAKSIGEIYQEIEETVALKSPQCMDDDFISNYYGIDASSLEDYVFSMSEDAAQAETIIIMKAKSSDDLEGLKDCLQTVVDEKKNEMENYIPEQFSIVEKSKVQTKDNYVWLVISDNADTVSDIIERGLF